MSNIHQIHLQSKHQQTMLDAQRLEQASEWIARIDRELQEDEPAKRGKPNDEQPSYWWFCS